MGTVRKSYIGRKFSRSIVIDEYRKEDGILWCKLECKCGEIFERKKRSIHSAKKMSCGCGKRRTKDPVSITHPEVAKQWDYSKNTITPDKITMGSNKKFWFKCQYGHEWKTSLNNRTAGGSCCPKCKGHSSRAEARVYSELKTVFSDLKWGEKIDNAECDIIIPCCRICIEIDGYYWHKNKFKKDKEKNKKFIDNGYSPIRIRAKGLKKINDHDIFYNDRTGITIDNMIEILKFINKKTKKRVFLYKNKKFVNEKDFKSLSIKKIGRNKKSILALYPDIIEKEYDYEKNYPLLPEHLTEFSNIYVWWKCEKNHSWRAQVYNRHLSNKAKCPCCLGRKRDV